MSQLNGLYHVRDPTLLQRILRVRLLERQFDNITYIHISSVGARTLTVPNFGNSAVFVEVVSGVMNQNSLRGVGVESKCSFCNKPMV